MSEKTEAPTQKKLRDARKRGQVAKSKDIAKALAFLTFVVWISFAGESLFDRFRALVAMVGTQAALPFQPALSNLLETALRELVLATLVPLGLLAAVALAVELFDTGVVFAPERLKITPENISPLKTLKNWFSLRNLVELAKSLLKITVIGMACFQLIADNVNGLLWVPAAGAQALGIATGRLLSMLLWVCAVAFLVFAAADLLIQKRLFRRDQRMSKDEVKREYKETEGDPHIKGHRKSLQREMMREPARQATRRSTAVIVNPTHLAVALRYVAGQTPLPMVMAAGSGLMAQLIREEAARHDIPVVQDVALARVLWRECDPGDYIPLELIDPVAAVLAAIDQALPGREPADRVIVWPPDECA